MNDETDQKILNLLNKFAVDEELIRYQKKQLNQPVTRVRPDNIFSSHLSQHTIFEDETDPKLLKKGVLLNPVGVTKEGALTEAQISVQEKRLGIRIPDPWREVYKYFNGGWVEGLYWGDLHKPSLNDIIPIPQIGHEYLALEEVAPLRDILPGEMDGVDCSTLDSRLIAIACWDCQAVLLDYRQGSDPRVCRAYFNEYDENWLDCWEEDEFTFWWPNVQVFFRGLYLQDRIV